MHHQHSYYIPHHPPNHPLPLPPSPSLVDCNDSLYAGDRKLVAEVSKLVHTLLEQVLDHMKELSTTTEVGTPGQGHEEGWGAGRAQPEGLVYLNVSQCS